MLLGIGYLYPSVHDGAFDVIQTEHHLFYARSIDPVNLELGFFRLGQKLKIFQDVDESFFGSSVRRTAKVSPCQSFFRMVFANSIIPDRNSLIVHDRTGSTNRY